MASQEPLVARYNLISLLTWCHRNIRNLTERSCVLRLWDIAHDLKRFSFILLEFLVVVVFFNSAQYTCTTTRTRLPVIFLLFLALVKLAPASPFYVEMDSPFQKVSCFIDVAKPCRSVKWDCNLTPNFSCNWSRDDICVTLSQKKSEPSFVRLLPRDGVVSIFNTLCGFELQYLKWISRYSLSK